MAKEKSTRGNASQFFVAGELCRRGYLAVVTMGNTPNTDILCSNIDGTRFVHIQVKTFLYISHVVENKISHFGGRFCFKEVANYGVGTGTAFRISGKSAAMETPTIHAQIKPITKPGINQVPIAAPQVIWFTPLIAITCSTIT